MKLSGILFAFATAAGLSQSLTQVPVERPKFEVVSIRPTAPEAPEGIKMRQVSGEVLNVEGYSLSMLLELTFGVKRYQIIGAPEWVKSARYNIHAKATAPVSAKEMWPMLLQSWRIGSS